MLVSGGFLVYKSDLVTGERLIPILRLPAKSGHMIDILPLTTVEAAVQDAFSEAHNSSLCQKKKMQIRRAMAVHTEQLKVTRLLGEHDG